MKDSSIKISRKQIYICFGIVIFIILVVIVVLIFMLVNKPKNLDDILIDNQYKLEKEIEKGTESEEGEIFTRKTYKYQKGEIPLLVYEYENFEEIKKELMDEYQVESEHEAFTVEVENKDNYYYKRTCDANICLYDLGYDTMLVSTAVGVDLSSSVDEIFREIIKEGKLD